MKQLKVIVMTYKEKDEKTGGIETKISHGILEDLSRNITLENAPLSEAIALGWVKFDPHLGEYILV